ncbi:MAG: toprim domain-containing protein [Sphingomonas sp.]|uniref:DUF7146 domain-containing protein n=1 Tax=Sphingomonas sp. TaxID=28214 RepID=UPI0026294CC7|nr:toprim domain-containing protein [Sphingomonas sp.]MDK2768410.1 toprim domain-containing protein [Sphingomonas sp.]
MSTIDPSHRLHDAAAEVVRSLGGLWRPGGAMCHCPAHDDRTPSLSVRVGTTSLLFKCFAGCRTVDVIKALRRRNLPIPVERFGGTVICRSTGFAAQARRLWDLARPLADTPGAHYLTGRGITARPWALRYLHATPLGRGNMARFRPALIAAIHDGAELVAVQRTFLGPAGGGLATDLAKPKLALGRPRAGAVKLARAGSVLGLAEGVETALSAMQLLGIPVWATLGGERLPHIRIPALVHRLVLLPDADRSGRIAERLSRSAYAGLAIEIQTVWPWSGLKDWNDVLREEGKGEAGRLRLAV